MSKSSSTTLKRLMFKVKHKFKSLFEQEESSAASGSLVSSTTRIEKNPLALSSGDLTKIKEAPMPALPGFMSKTNSAPMRMMPSKHKSMGALKLG